MSSLRPALILARGGSKGIPKKNILTFAGKPLIAWSILQARDSGVVDAVLVSSDSEEILEIAAHYGAVPIKRPAELSGDSSSSEEALLHALDQFRAEQGADSKEVVFLQATSPLREPADIAAAVRAFEEQRADSLFSDAVLDDFCVWMEEGGRLKGKTFDPWARGRRQDRQPLYLETGSIYVFNPALLRETGSRLGGKIVRFTMPYWKSHEIDKLEDVELCEFYFEKHLLPYWQAQEVSFGKESVRLIVYDFDGVMTNNHVLQFQDGTEGVLVNRADGWGVGQIEKMGIPQLILSTETNPVVAARGRKLNIEVIQSCGDKKTTLAGYCEKLKIDLSSVLYLGNDLNDLEVMRVVGFPVAPADAHPAVVALAKHVTRAKGGEGVIKELSEYVSI